MSEPFIAEVKIFASNFAPRGYAFCDGQLLQISQFSALFSLVGTTFGGDGRITFGLPNLQGRAVMHPGNGPGLTPRSWGETGGAQSHTLSVNEMPSHNHTVNTSSPAADAGDPAAAHALATGDYNIYGPPADTVAMSADTVGNSGGNQAHNNMQPYLVLHYIIALTGIFPSRN